MHRLLLAHLGDHAYGWRLDIRVYEFVRSVFLGNIKIPNYLMEGKLVLFNKTSSDIPSIKDTRPITVLNGMRKLIELIWLEINADALWGTIGYYQMGFRLGGNTQIQVLR